MSIYTTNNRLKQLLETRKGSTISMGGVTLLIVVLMIFFAVLPAYRSITDQLKNNEAKTKYFEELKIKKSSLDKLATTYQNNKLTIDYFNLYNNPIKNTETFVANVDVIAKWNNCLLKNIKITGGINYRSPEGSPFTDFASLEPQQLQMEFIVKLANIPSLLNSLEEFPLPIYIYSMNVVQVQGLEYIADKVALSENDSVILSVIGEIYFWKDNSL